MNQQEKSEQALVKARVKAKCDAPACRAVVIAACMGVVIGLMLKLKRQ